MTIHKEGRPLLLALIPILLLINCGVSYVFNYTTISMGLSLAFSLFFYILILQFFRQPHITVHTDANHILSPADGIIVVMKPTEIKEHLTEQRYQISIFMSPFDVHINRSPVKGVVSYYKYHLGKYLVAWHPKSSDKNEHTTLAIKMDNGIEVLLRQIAGTLARRIKCYVSENKNLQQGQEFGFIKFGSRVDLFLPLDTVPQVKLGDRVKGGKSVIATWS